MSEPQAKRLKICLPTRGFEPSPQEPNINSEVHQNGKHDGLHNTAAPQLAKHELLRLQLAVLLHASRCQARASDSCVTGRVEEPCRVKNCLVMRDVLVHISICTADKCPEAHCTSSKGILRHWNQCTSASCVVCSPVRRVIEHAPCSGVNGSNGHACHEMKSGKEKMNGSMHVGSHVHPSSVSKTSSITCTVTSEQNCSINNRTLTDSIQPVCVSDTTSRNNMASLNPACAVVQSRRTDGAAPVQSSCSRVSSGKSKPGEGVVYGGVVQNGLTTVKHHVSGLAEHANHINGLSKAAAVTQLSVSAPIPPPSGAARTNGHLFSLPVVSKQCNGVESKSVLNGAKTIALNGHVDGYDNKLDGCSLPKLNGAMIHGDAGGKLTNDWSSSQKSVADSSVANHLNRSPLSKSPSDSNKWMASTCIDSSSIVLKLKKSPDCTSTPDTGRSLSSVAQNSAHRSVLPVHASHQTPLSGEVRNGALHHRVQSAVQGLEILKNISNRDGLNRLPHSTIKTVDALSETMSPVVWNGIVTEVAVVNGLRVEASRPSSTGCIVWNAKQLCRVLTPCLVALFQRNEAAPFRQPVDPVLLQCPDYYEVIAHPMDLSSIRRKLDSYQYVDPWQMIDDLQLMLNNCWVYNRRCTKVFKQCTKLSKVAVEIMEPVMHSLGYCCGEAYTFSPVMLHCSGRPLCSVHPYAWYYCYDKFILCEHCYLEGNSNTISLTEDPSLPALVVSKELFRKLKNIEVEPEKLAMCVECGRRQHMICSLHVDEIWSTGFVCRRCQCRHDRQRHRNLFTAKNLPYTELGAYLERRVRALLTRYADSCAQTVHVRVLAATRKTTDVRPGMRSQFPDEPAGFPYTAKTVGVFQEVEPGVDVCFFILHTQEYGDDCPEPNRRRVYLAYMDSVNYFQPRELRSAVYHEILIGYMNYIRALGYLTLHIWACPPLEGDDYIFNSHPVDQKIPRPKRLQDWYKKMLDKATLEGAVYDYKDVLEDFTDRGLKSANELPYFDGDFWVTTIEELITALKPSVLSGAEGTVACVSEATVVAVSSEGAVVTTVESCIPVDRSTPVCEQSMPLDSAVVGDSVDVDVETPSPSVCLNEQDCGGKFTSTQEVIPCTASVANKKTNNKKKKSRDKKPKKPGGCKKRSAVATGPQDLSSKLLQALNRHKESFFVVLLRSPGSMEVPMVMLADPDPLMPSELMEVRGNFLLMARDEHCEFSSLRHAKFSTMVLLYEVHRERTTNAPCDAPSLSSACAQCGRCTTDSGSEVVGVLYKCSVCTDYCLCASCYETVEHEHELTSIDESSPHDVSVTTGSSDAVARRPFSFASQKSSPGLIHRRCTSLADRRHAVDAQISDVLRGQVVALEHASSCMRGLDCASVWCPRIRSVIEHARTCTSYSCAQCMDLRAVADAHARICVALEGSCSVCEDAKSRVQNSRRHRARQQSLMMQRRMAQMDRTVCEENGRQGDGV